MDVVLNQVELFLVLSAHVEDLRLVSVAVLAAVATPGKCAREVLKLAERLGGCLALEEVDPAGLYHGDGSCREHFCFSSEADFG